MDVRIIVLLVLAILVAAGVLYQVVGSRRDLSRHPAPGTLVDVGGYRLHARCMGEGRPVVVFEAGCNAVAASKLLKGPTSVVTVPGATHESISSGSAFEQSAAAAADWFLKHL